MSERPPIIRDGRFHAPQPLPFPVQPARDNARPALRLAGNDGTLRMAGQDTDGEGTGNGSGDAPDIAHDVLARFDDVTRQIDDLSHGLSALWQFKDDDRDRPRAA